MAQKRGLGIGLDALIPTVDEPDEEQIATQNGSTILDIDLVEPNRDQPRKAFDEDALNELADSIKQFGVISPIIVQKRDDYYEIIAGERRWRASRLAGLKEVPVIIREFSDQETLIVSLIENLQRRDLNPIEEALAYKRLIDDFDLKQDEVAERVSKSRSAVTNSMRLLKLDPKVQQMLIDDMIKEGHARQILSLPEGVDQYSFAERVFDERMSVRDVEKAVKDMQKVKKEKNTSSPKNAQMDAVLGEIEEKLKASLGTKVRINTKDKDKGTIEIEYYSREQLSELLDILQN